MSIQLQNNIMSQASNSTKQHSMYTDYLQKVHIHLKRWSDGSFKHHLPNNVRSATLPHRVPYLSHYGTFINRFIIQRRYISLYKPFTYNSVQILSY